MELALLTAARCNARCAHCSTSCGPTRSEALASDKIRQLMDEAAVLSAGEPLAFHLSGGEPFLDLELLLGIIAHGRSLGASVTCVTNASWASSLEKARGIVSRVQGAGLRGLAISTSRFHLPYVKLQRAQHAYAAARELELRCVVKHVFTGAPAPDEGRLTEWIRSLPPEDVQEVALLPHLHRDAEALPEAAFPRSPGLPTGTCPAAILTVREDGEAYACCTPGAFKPLLRLGNAAGNSLRALRNRFASNGVQQILRRHGPIFFARAAIAAGQGAQLRPGYADACDLCTDIAAKPALARIAAAAGAALERDQIGQLLHFIEPAQGAEGQPQGEPCH